MNRGTGPDESSPRPEGQPDPNPSDRGQLWRSSMFEQRAHEYHAIESLPDRLTQPVSIAGMVVTKREFKSHAFLVVEDHTGLVQVVVSKSPGEQLPTVGSFITAKGTVASAKTKWMPCELQAQQVDMLAACPATELPVMLDRKPLESMELLLDERALSLRNISIGAAFRFQALVGRAFRESMRAQGFVEIHTPKLVAGGTEGGAAVFAVRYFDRDVSLAQSPQLYKQIAAGALQRVYEIGAVYRAENSNTSRHLTEFVGLDFEMTFIRDEHDVMDVLQRFIAHTCAEVKQQSGKFGEFLSLDIPATDNIPRIWYEDAFKLAYPDGVVDPDKNFDSLVGEAVRRETGSRFVFVYGYPREEKPFYIMPHEEHPGFTRSFDLLFDGLEICSGGQRVHNYDQLVANMTLHGLDPSQYKWYLDAFQYGMPPHGGAGMGLERLAQRLAGLSNVRDMSMFPRDTGRTSP